MMAKHQGRRSRASSVLSDVIESGFYDDNAQQDGDYNGDESRPTVSSTKPTLSLSLSELQGNEKSGEVSAHCSEV